VCSSDLEKDVWDYHRLYKIPHCMLYDMGHKRNGCWACAMGIRNGQLGRLRASHPRLFRRLLLRTPMGNGIMRARALLRGERVKDAYHSSEISDLLRNVPEAFDVL